MQTNRTLSNFAHILCLQSCAPVIRAHVQFSAGGGGVELGIRTFYYVRFYFNVLSLYQHGENCRLLGTAGRWNGQNCRLLGNAGRWNGQNCRLLGTAGRWNGLRWATDNT